MNFILLLSMLVVIVILAIYCWWLIVWAFAGISIMSTSRQAVKAVVAIIKKYGLDDGFFYDLGCGQGYLARQIKKALPRINAVGIEGSLNQYLFGIIKNALSLNKIKLFRQNIFNSDISPAGVIYLYLPRTLLPRLKEKIKKEAKPGALIITNTVSFTDWQPIETIVTNQKSPNFEKLFIYKI